MARARISLCMIVRDEARMIDACLASVRGLVSEIIVVDTGSKDDTPDRARRAGAKVFSVPWQDDFSHARNASLSHATGDWVLILDADERVIPADFARLSKLLSKATFDCGMVRIHDASTLDAKAADVASGKARMGDSHRVPRLVRRTPDMAYTGVIHETLGPWLTRRGGAIAAVDLDLVHYGATRELFVDRAKYDRNVKLLRALADNDPRDPTALGYLAAQHLESHELDLAHAAVEEGWRRLAFVEQSLEYRPSILRLADVRAMVQLWHGDLRGVLETVQRAERYEGSHYDFDHLAGYALELLAVGARDRSARERYLRAARASFERCLASAHIIHWHAFVVGASGWSAWTRLGTVDLLLGDPARARTAFERALALQSTDIPEARLGLLEAKLHTEGPRAALADVRALVDDATYRDTPDLWILAAEACEALGVIKDMASFLGRARDAKGGYVAKFRRAQHAERVAALALYRGAPVAGSGLVGMIGALVSRSPVDPAFVGAWPSNAVVVARLVRNVASCGKLATLEPLFEPRADVLVPGLRDHVKRAATELGLGLLYQPPPDTLVVEGEDAEKVAALLAAHPRLVSRVTLASNRTTARARVIHAGPPTEGASPATVQVTWAALVDDPVRECDRVLALLGEGDATALVRHMTNAYEQRATA